VNLTPANELRLATHYIPLSRSAVTDLCRTQLDASEQTQFDALAALLTAWYHHYLHAQLEALKDHYRNHPETFAATLDQVARAANFSAITRQDLDQALQEESIFQLRLAVDFADFKELVFYRRGESTRQAQVDKWFGLRRHTIDFNNYDMVLVYVRFRDLKPGEDEDDVPFEPDASLLKLFSNVPQADLEMLFPNTKIRMRWIDKLLIGVPAFVSGVVVLTTKIGGTLILLSGVIGFWLGFSGEPVTLDQGALAALLTGAVTLGGYLWKQYSNFKNRKIRFMKTLTESLYFRTLAHNEGVLTHIVDNAEESEVKEVLLGYVGLHVLGAATASELKAWVDEKLAATTDFDTQDALEKLIELQLATRGDDGKFVSAPLTQAYRVLDQRWDALFHAS
jgi:hypothetical protein